MIKQNQRRLTVSLNDLRDYDRAYWSRLISHPSESIPMMEKALKSVALSMAEGSRLSVMNDEDWYVGFDGSLPQAEVNPRTLMASFLGKLVVLEGIVTKGMLDV